MKASIRNKLARAKRRMERVNGRLKIFWGADDGNITGARRFHALVGAVMVVHAGFATLLASAPRRDGTLGACGRRFRRRLHRPGTPVADRVAFHALNSQTPSITSSPKRCESCLGRGPP